MVSDPCTTLVFGSLLGSKGQMGARINGIWARLIVQGQRVGGGIDGPYDLVPCLWTET